MKNKDTLLGKAVNTNENIFITPKTRSTHTHIIGSTGVGKSKFMEHLIREDILNGEGLCLIDPHGYLYDEIIRWCETKRFLGRKKILLFNPSEENWTFAFNPLKISSSSLSYHVDTMVQACAKVWGGENTDKTPLLKKCLRMLFYALADKKLSLLEAQHVINPLNSNLKEFITNGIADSIIQNQWNYLNRLNDKQFHDEFSSTINRMMEFLSSPIIRNIIGQTENSIDFRKIMDEGYILLVNLASKNQISDDNARLLGTLIVNDLFTNAKGRPEKSRPFYLYIDECARYINDDIGRILDEGRKFGLHLILANQHLSQLKKAGEDIYKSVMTSARTKVVFGGLDTEDAEIMANRIFIGEIDLEEPKKILNKPTVVGYIKTWLNNYSHGKSTASGESQALGTGITKNVNLMENNYDYTYVDDDARQSDSKNESVSSTNSKTESEGFSETFLPELEERPTQVYSFEEQIYKAMALMINQPTQHAIIKMPDQKSCMVKTPTVEPGYARDERVKSFKEESYRLADFARPRIETEKYLEERQRLFVQKPKTEFSEGEDVAEPKTFKIKKKGKKNE